MADIEERLSDAGYAQFKSGESLIRDILAEGDARHLKAVPYLIYKYRPRPKTLYEDAQEELVDTLIHYTKRIAHELGLDIDLPDTEERMDLGFEEYAHEFLVQLRRSEAPSARDAHERRREELARSHLFTNKEREILRKIEAGKELTKTEYEYYSRKTKKKLESVLLLEESAKTLLTKDLKRADPRNT